MGAGQQPSRADVKRRPGAVISPQTYVVSASFAIAFVCLASLALAQGQKPLYFDSGSYWSLGETFVKHGDFSLLNFDSPLRGYLLPLGDHALQGAANVLQVRASTAAKLFNAFVFALIGAVLAPRLAELTWSRQRWGLRRRLALCGLLAFFWSGFLNFPLSDFPALAAMLIALIALAHRDRPGWMLLAGMATGAAIDVRPSYVLLAPIMLGLMAWSWLEERRAGAALCSRRRTLCLGLAVVGFAIVSLPQSLASHRHFHTWSFVPGAAARLESLQLTEGLRLQRVGGYVGPGYPPLMSYEDPEGQALLNGVQGHVVTGLGQYLGLVLAHPVTMAGLFARHVVNGLDQRYSTPYVEHLDDGSHRWMRAASFLFVFLALLRVLWPAARRRLGPARWRYPLAVLACCLTSVPSAMETRYLLPAYLLVFMLVLAAGWPRPLRADETTAWRKYRVAVAITIACIAYAAVVSSAVRDASSHLHFVV